MSTLARLAAAATLAAVLACSSLGTCWLLFLPEAHSCCAPDSGIQATTRSCASAATCTAPPYFAPLAPALLPVAVDVSWPEAGHVAGPLLASGVFVRPPPLVLRI
jgi:hypothetical protein